MDKLKQTLLARHEDQIEQLGLLNEASDENTLNWTTRLTGFLVCVTLGIILSTAGTLFLLVPGIGGLRIFILFYTLGNLTTIGSSVFLMGPMRQFERMFEEKRLVATLLFFACLVLTLLSALLLRSVVFAVIFCVLQSLSFTWYSISYIPFARNVVKNMLATCLDV